MTPDQHARILELHAEGASNREIAKAVGLSHVTVAKVLKVVTKVVTQVVTPGVVTPLVTPSGNPPETGLGMRLSPRELLDAKEAGTLPFTALLDGGGVVVIPKAGPLWPRWEATGEVRIGLSGTTYPVMKPMPSRPARRADSSKG